MHVSNDWNIKTLVSEANIVKASRSSGHVGGHSECPSTPCGSGPLGTVLSSYCLVTFLPASAL